MNLTNQPNSQYLDHDYKKSFESDQQIFVEQVSIHENDEDHTWKPPHYILQDPPNQTKLNPKQNQTGHIDQPKPQESQGSPGEREVNIIKDIEKVGEEKSQTLGGSLRSFFGFGKKHK